MSLWPQSNKGLIKSNRLAQPSLWSPPLFTSLSTLAQKNLQDLIKLIKISSPSHNLVSITMFGGSGNYASSLYLVTAKQNTLEKVESELLELVEATKNRQHFYSSQRTFLCQQIQELRLSLTYVIKQN